MNMVGAFIKAMKDFNIVNTSLYDLLKKGRALTIPPGQVFQSTDHRESFTLIEKGYVKRYSITNEGDQSIQIIHGPGNILSLTFAFRVLFNQALYDGPEIFYYETITAARLYSINENTLKAACEADPILYSDLLQVCGTRLNYLVHTRENMATRHAYNRLAHQLLYFCRQFGVKTPSGVKIMVPLTQQTIASSLDIARETVAINLKLLRGKKIIQIDEKLIMASDIKRLKEEAYA